jgi:WD40 repeat protein
VTPSCPPADQLERLLADQLDAATDAAVAAHVQGCAACQQRLERLLAPATGSGAVTVPPAGPPAPDAVATLLGRLAHRGPGTDGPSGGAADPGLPEVPGYEVEAEVGRGGMGVIYRARHRGLGRTVALKMILAGAEAGPEEHARFRTEAAAVARLQHAHIVQVHDAGEHQGRPYLALEFIDGGSLKDALDGTPRPTRDAAALVETLARAVHHAHQRGIVHRDLKPANVLLTADGTPRVTDFGLAKLVAGPAGGAGPTRTGAVVGTPSYMAPEQADGKKEVGPAADVYALGVILYELLTGRPPFQAATPLDTLLQVLHDEPVPVGRLSPQVPRDLETVCHKCLHKEPHCRYASAEALADELGRFLRGEPVRARPVGKVERLRRWCRRNPAQAAAAGLAAVAVLAGVALVIGAFFTARLREKQGQTEAALAEVQKYRCQLALERGLTLCEQDDVPGGILWLSHALEIAPAQDTDLQRDIRANLAGWGRQVHSLRAILPHPGFVRAAAFSPDGKLVLTGSFDRAARLWQADTGKLLAAWPHPDRVEAVAFSPDGKTVATGSRDGTVRLWDPATGQPLPRESMRHEDAVWTVAFSPDGQTLVTGSRDRTGRLWEVATGKRVGEPLNHQGEVMIAAFSPDGESVVTAGEGAAPRLWDRRGTGPYRDAPWGHTDLWVLALVFSRDRKTALTATGTGIAQLWDLRTGKPLGPPLQHQGGLAAVAFSPDGSSFATGGMDGLTRLWETATGRPLGAPVRHQDEVAAVAFSPDGQTLLTASGDQTARLWDASPGQPLGTSLPHAGYVYAAVFSPDGKFVLTGCRDRKARLWDTTTGKEVWEQPLPHRGFVVAVAFSPDGKTIATTSSEEDYSAYVWETATGRQVAGPLRHSAQIWAVTFSPDGRTLLTGSRDKKARLWEIATGEMRCELPHHDDVWAVAFSPDGQTVGTASEDATAWLWDAATGKLRHALRHPAGVNALAFGPPDGRLVLTGSRDGKARLWDVSTGRLRHELPHQGSVNAVAFSPDGLTVATGSSDWTARLWEAATGRPVGQPLQHHGPILKLAFSPNGQVIVTGSQDRTARLWSATTAKPFGTPLLHEGPVFSVAISPKDNQTVLTGDSKKALLWKPPAPVAGAVERIVLWTQVITGMELDADRGTRVLDAPTWEQRRRRLDELGGPPPP